MESRKVDFKKYFDSDTLLTMVITAVFVVAFVTTFQMEGVSTYLLPRLLSGTGTLLSLSILIVKYLRLPREETKTEKVSQAPNDGIHVVKTIFFTMGYFLLVRHLGFILTTTVAIWIFAVLMRYRNKSTVIIVGLLLPIVLHIFFVTLLKINLPRGMIESVLPF